jgi:predicted PurR-regulated permease PerM
MSAPALTAVPATPDLGGQPPAAESARRGAGREDMPLPHEPRTVFLGGLFFLACMAALYAAREVLLPIVLAIVLKLLLQPLVRALERVRVPKAVGALVAVLLLLGVFAGIGAILSGPATAWMHDMPDTMSKLAERFAPLKALMGRAQPLLSRVGLGGQTGEGLFNLVNPGKLAGGIASGVSGIASHLLETLLILFYLLVFGETFLRRVVEVLPTLGDKKEAVEISTQVERDLSVYLLTITVINAIVGCAVGGMMWLFGIAGAPLWGVIAFCFNFVPILGPFTGVALFVVAGLLTLGMHWFSLLPAVCYLAIHVAEGEIITPMILARRFTVNPVAVLLGLLFWYWMWGVEGAVLAVPLLAIAKIICDRIRPLRAFGHLLEG